jgi:5-methylcytosine-specific restriction endonuclease McrBC regulatory subunit McrC
MTERTVTQWVGNLPVLELKEHEDVKWVGDNYDISSAEEKSVQTLKKDYDIQITNVSDGIKISAGKDGVGVMQFEKFILNVKPKFVKFKNFGRLLDVTNNIPPEQSDDEIQFEGKFDHPIEFVIGSFLRSVEKLIQYGIYKSYVEHQDNISFLRGKLIMKNQILNDVKFNMKFNCEFDEFTSNNLENQIIRFTLEHCKFLTKFPQRKKLIEKLISKLDSQIELKRNIVVNDFRKISYTRLNSQYESPHKLAKLIIQNIGLQNFNYQRTKFIVPFFVKMWEEWEKFLGNLFENYYDDSVRVRQQEHHSAWVIQGQSHPIKPDMVLYRNGKILTVVDAKYMKELKVGGKEMYQIAFYINHLGISTGYAILPFENFSDYDIQVPLQNISIKVRHIPIDEYLDILYSKKSQKDIKKEISVRIKELIPLNT